MAALSLMFQGTGSDVGKSLVVAGLCRLFTRRGLSVAPFKAQNMSNNAAVTADGGEIGRAQWVQALACGIQPSVHMNPVLLKPQSDQTSQVIVRGKVSATMNAKDYQNWRLSLLPAVVESYRLLAENTDLVIAEGAGSPAEINLRQHDIANMGFARAVQCTVVLIGDIERGGVIASIVGTFAVLEEQDRNMIAGFLVNKFRGDASLFASAAVEIERLTGWPDLGLIPHYPLLAQLPQEDSLALEAVGHSSGGALHIVVLATPHLANFDDIDPLRNEPGVKISWCQAGDVLPADAHLVILPGSKSTLADLAFIRQQGWDIDLKAHHRRGGRIIGLCGGYQMLGKTLSDPQGYDGTAGIVEGLGLLDMSTEFAPEKTVTPWQGRFADSDINVTGYEIHLGVSRGTACANPLFHSKKGAEGARSTDGLIWGTYIHGLFASDTFRHHLLQSWGAGASSYAYGQHMQHILDGWADVLEASVNIDRLLSIARPV